MVDLGLIMSQLKSPVRWVLVHLFESGDGTTLSGGLLWDTRHLIFANAATESTDFGITPIKNLAYPRQHRWIDVLVGQPFLKGREGPRALPRPSETLINVDHSGCTAPSSTHTSFTRQISPIRTRNFSLLTSGSLHPGCRPPFTWYSVPVLRRVDCNTDCSVLYALSAFHLSPLVPRSKSCRSNAMGCGSLSPSPTNPSLKCPTSWRRFHMCFPTPSIIHRVEKASQ